MKQTALTGISIALNIFQNRVQSINYETNPIGKFTLAELLRPLKDRRISV